MAYSEKFKKVIGPHILAEGGWVKHPADPGGETYKGIARRYNSDWHGWILIDAAKERTDFPESLEDNADLQDLVFQRYYETYWKPMQLDGIYHPSVISEMFDMGAGPNGIFIAIKIVQGALVLLKQDVDVDGIMGPQTIDAINNYAYTDDLVKLMNLLQFTHLLLGSVNIDETLIMIQERLPQLKEFMRGWLKRITV